MEAYAVQTEATHENSLTILATPAELSFITSNAQLSKEKVERILADFRCFFDVLSAPTAEKAFAIVVTDESQTELIKSARDFRLELKDVRLRAELTRKQCKESSLREGQLIDGIGRKIKETCESLETHLRQQEDFAAIAEKNRINERLSQRRMLIEPYGIPVRDGEIREMSDEMFRIFVDGLRASFELKAEQSRIAEEKQQQEEKERAEREAVLRAENERLAAEKAEADRKTREVEAIAAQADRDRQKAEFELREKERLEWEARRREELEAERLLSAPDAEKFRVYAEAIRAVPLPAAASEAGKYFVDRLRIAQDQLAADAVFQASSLEAVKV